ncbi:hypothetical protein Lacidipiscis_00711 [Ligilactobacillus acidipiscis]|nr:hypothetical protein Lacidipiscis_00711 [Ligilactobacillus acidipiscis]
MMSQTDSILNLLNIQDPNIKISACTDFSQAGVHEKADLPRRTLC